MNRVIKKYTNITQHHIDLIAAAFPEGFSEEDVKVLSMPSGQYLRCLEVETSDTLYLFRIDEGMIVMLEEATDDDFGIDLDDDSDDLESLDPRKLE